MAEVPTNLAERIVDRRDDFSDEITRKNLRPYFAKIDCSLRVLGSQFGLEPGKLTDLERLSGQSLMDLRQLLLKECFNQEKITSWQQFVTVLEKPAINHKSIADDVRRRFSLTRQVSMDSATSSMTAMSPMSPLQSISSMEASGSFSSSIGTKTGGIELCDAVNEIMKVPYHNLYKLGGNLGLDEGRIQELLSTTQYGPVEKRQRLMEMWFTKEWEPTWEKLHRALSLLDLMSGPPPLILGESSTLMDSVPAIPLSHIDSMLRSNLEDIESRFSDLLYSVQCALEASNVQVDHVRQILIGIFHREDCIPNTNLAEIFSAVTAHNLWNYNHHSPVERLVRRCLRDRIGEVTEYKGHLSGFYATTKLIDYIRYTNVNNAKRGPSELPLDSYNTEYETLTVKLNTGRDISSWSLMYVQELWNSFAEEFRIPSLTAVIGKVLEGCLEITWLIPPHEAEQIVALAPKSEPFFRRHNVAYVSLDGCIIYDTNQMDTQEIDQTALLTLEDSYQSNNEEPMSITDSIVPQKAKETSIHSGTLQHPSSLSDTESVIGDFERHFTELLAKAKSELLLLKKSVDTVYMLLKTLSARDFHKYVCDLRGRPLSNFDELFDDLNSYRGNFLEYELLEAIIKRNNCSIALRRDMERYAHDVGEFKRHIAISKLFKFQHRILKRKSPLKRYKKLTTKFNVDSEKCTLATIYHFRDKVHSIKKIPLHWCKIDNGSVIVEWRFLKEHDYALMEYICSKEGKDLLEQCEISEILIDDTPVNHSLLFLTAAAREEWETVDALLQDKIEDIDLNYSNANDGWTALFQVIVKGPEHVDLVEKMLELDANPNVQDTDGWTPLMRAIEAGNKEMVDVLLQRQCDINLQENTRGWSALHIAANTGKMDIVEILINFTSEYEVDIMQRDRDGKSVLQIAEEKQHSEIVKMLTELTQVDSEIDLAQKGDEDSPTLQQAEQIEGKDDGRGSQLEKTSDEQEHSPRMGVLKRIRHVLRRNPQDIKINRAAVRGSVADVQKALDSGANPNCITNLLTQRTPLIEASERGHTEVVKLLLSRGADTKKITADNRSALTLASKRGHIETVEELLKHGLPCVIVNMKTGFWKWTILHSICFCRGHEKHFTKEEFLKQMEKIVELLLKNGADPFIGDRTGDTALTFASFRGYVGLVKVLVENTPPERQKELIDHQRDDKWSALLLASRHGHTEVVKYLLEKQASMTVSNKAKMTALHLGVSGGHVETVKQLAENADPSALNAIDGHGYTPLFIATKLKSLKLVEVLAEAGADPYIQSKKEKTTPQGYATKLNLIAISNALSQRQYLSSEQVQKHATTVHQRATEAAQTQEIDTQLELV